MLKSRTDRDTSKFLCAAVTLIAGPHRKDDWKLESGGKAFRSGVRVGWSRILELILRMDCDA